MIISTRNGLPGSEVTEVAAILARCFDHDHDHDGGYGTAVRVGTL